MLEYEYAKVLSELIASERAPLLEEKWAALQKIIGRANAYKKEGFLEEIICKFVQYYAEAETVLCSKQDCQFFRI